MPIGIHDDNPCIGQGEKEEGGEARRWPADDVPPRYRTYCTSTCRVGHRLSTQSRSCPSVSQAKGMLLSSEPLAAYADRVELIKRKLTRLELHPWLRGSDHSMDTKAR